jgi:hypothetical protein
MKRGKAEMRETIGARLRQSMADGGGNSAYREPMTDGGGSNAHPDQRVAVLLATKSYPYLYGLGDRMCIEWHTEAAVQSIVKHVITHLQHLGYGVDVYAAVEEADGLQTLCDELLELGVSVVRSTTASSTHYFLRCQAACHSLGLLAGGYDYLVMLRPDLLFDGPVNPSSWSPSAVNCRARTYKGPRPPADPNLLSWWDQSSFAPSPTLGSFVPDDQLFVVSRTCADDFARAPTPEELRLMQKAANGATFGMEAQVGALMRHRGVELRCTAMPCVLMKHEALKARYGRDAPPPLCTYRAEPSEGVEDEDF